MNALARIKALEARMAGYQAENEARKTSGYAPAYHAQSFFDIEQELMEIHNQLPSRSQIYEIIDTVIDAPNVFKPTEITSREIGCHYDYLWMTIDAQGSWSMAIDVCTIADNKPFWACIGRIDQRHFSGIVAIKPLMIGKPDKIRVRLMGTDGRMRIIGRASDLLDLGRKASIGFVDCTI